MTEQSEVAGFAFEEVMSGDEGHPRLSLSAQFLLREKLQRDWPLVFHSHTICVSFSIPYTCPARTDPANHNRLPNQLGETLPSIPRG
jgi:hypothetical protein